MKDTYNDIYKAFQKCDEKWIQRKRKINTASLFNTLVNCCTQGRGVNHILRMEMKISLLRQYTLQEKNFLKVHLKKSTIFYRKDREDRVYLRLTVLKYMYILPSWRVGTKQEPMINQSRDQQRDL